MRRRDLILGLAGAGVWRSARGEEPGRVYSIGILTGLPRSAPNYVAFLAGLGRLGFVEGKNLRVDEKGYGLSRSGYAPHAADLARQEVDLMQCSGADALRAAQAATKTIPIMGATDDLVGEGFAKSFARPGGNITGVSILAPDLDGKRLQLLIELLPGARRVAALAGSDSATPARLEALRRQAHGKRVELDIRMAQKPEDIAPALDAFGAEGAAGINVLASAFLHFNRQLIFERTAALRLPAIYQWPEYVHEGGLIGYGQMLARIYRDQLSRIGAELLRGAKPAGIPVENPTHFYLSINLKAARALGLAVPPLLLAQAEEVIE
jgi:putative ABC transport system substrate-binding protein